MLKKLRLIFSATKEQRFGLLNDGELPSFQISWNAGALAPKELKCLSTKPNQSMAYNSIPNTIPAMTMVDGFLKKLWKLKPAKSPVSKLLLNPKPLPRYNQNR